MKRVYLPLLLLLTLIFQNCVSTKNAKPAAVYPLPTQNQLEWQDLETYAFIHFTINTFTDKEWGYGNESPKLFDPSHLNVDQWAKTIKDAGLKAIILTCKHHDGFTLWPSKYTEHSIANSPYKNGKGDIVKEVSEACKKYGLKFGVYLSPWDRNRADYGTPGYIEYYRNQLKELFLNYGPIFEMWFDGANGGDGYYGGTNEKRKINGKTYYNWPETLKLIRSIQPEVLFFSDAGPEIRWVGNERGLAGETNWNPITLDSIYAGKAGIGELLNTGNENGKSWVPAEVDVSIRPGWFYHQSQDNQVKTPEELFQIYLTSVGRGSNLLLNIPPDKEGLINEIDVKSLLSWRNLLNVRFRTNLALAKKCKANSIFNKNFGAKNITDGDSQTYWAARKNTKSATIEIDLGDIQSVKYLELQEYIALGQRVKAFSVEVLENNNWKTVANETTIGHKRILQFSDINTNKIRIDILDAKAEPLLSEIKVY